MGIYLERYLLRNDYQFDSIIEEVARDVAMAIRNEPEDTPYHTQRVAMAEKVLGQRDDVVSRFYRELKDQAVRSDPIRTEAFKSNLKDSEGRAIPDSGSIPDAMLLNGMTAIWNDAALIAWPNIIDETEPAAEPEPEGEA